MKKLSVRFTRSREESFFVGTLAEADHRIFFEYAPEFLQLGLNLSPFRLPFEPILFEHKDLDFGPLPGLFDDSLPDGWGLLLMNRHFRKIGRDQLQISPLDRLSWLGSQTMGALTYHPSAERGEVDTNIFDLHDLARNSQQILAGDAVKILPQLLQAGGSPAGARPKVLVGVCGEELISGEDNLPNGFEHWIVKFSAKEDAPDAGPVEYAYSLMARSAGLNIPPAKLFRTSKNDRFFGTKRFDRDRNRRFHIHSFGNLIQANFRIPSCDYLDLLKTTSILTRNFEDLLQVFRRMVFNVLAHNRDDHVKNFAFVIDDLIGTWSLSPAYDLTYTTGPGFEHTMTLSGEGRQPGRPHIYRLAEEVGISKQTADHIIDDVSDSVARWKTFAQEAGVSKKGLTEINKSLQSLSTAIIE